MKRNSADKTSSLGSKTKWGRRPQSELKPAAIPQFRHAQRQTSQGLEQWHEACSSESALRDSASTHTLPSGNRRQAKESHEKRKHIQDVLQLGTRCPRRLLLCNRRMGRRPREDGEPSQRFAGFSRVCYFNCNSQSWRSRRSCCSQLPRQLSSQGQIRLSNKIPFPLETYPCARACLTGAGVSLRGA
jgi:hypothetical protein